MFHHIVLMRFTAATDARFLAEVERYADRIRRELPYVRAYAFVRNAAGRAQGYDWAVIAHFDDSAAHDAYQVSDAHQEMKAYMAPFIADLIACDAAT